MDSNILSSSSCFLHLALHRFILTPFLPLLQVTVPVDCRYLSSCWGRKLSSMQWTRTRRPFNDIIYSSSIWVGSVHSVVDSSCKIMRKCIMRPGLGVSSVVDSLCKIMQKCIMRPGLGVSTDWDVIFSSRSYVSDSKVENNCYSWELIQSENFIFARHFIFVDLTIDRRLVQV